jgi:tetratricopeptide (TPR) repeat protein
VVAVDADAVVEEAIAALKTVEPATVLPRLDRALKRAPGDARLWHLKGLVHRADERRELALPALKRAAELAPAMPLIANGLARTLLEAGLPAVDAFAKALKLSPGDPEILKGLVAALIAARRTGDAIAGLARAVAQSPLWVDGHDLLADLRWLEGEREDFTRSFDEALVAHPRNLALRRQQIIKLLHACQYEQLLARIDEGRRAMGDNDIFAANEAIAYAEMGDIERADALFEPIADLADSSVQVRRTRHLLRAGRPEQASELIDRWLDTPEAYGFWPYASAAWRMTGDRRWDWLDADGSLVGVYDLSDRLPPLDKLADTLRTLHTTNGQPLVQSVRGGTQTDGHLFQMIDPTIVALREAIRAAVCEHAAALPDRDARHPTLAPPRKPIRFSGAWSVRLRAGGFHANHVHPMGWLSSALYIVLPPDLGRDESGVLTLGDPSAPSLPLDLPPVRTVEPKPARLALFPSWMWHGTRPFGEGERMTVAFDVAVPLGTTG